MNADNKIKLHMPEPIIDYNNGGEPLTEPLFEGGKHSGNRIVTAQLCAVRACMNLLRGEEDMTGDQKIEAFNLGMRLSREGGDDFTPGEIKKIQGRVRKSGTPLIVGQVDALIEQALK